MKLKENLETILPEHYETNDNGQYIRKSFKANGLTVQSVQSAESP
jgi:hypothetical protein